MPARPVDLLPDVQPTVFIAPVTEEIARASEASAAMLDPGTAALFVQDGFRTSSIGQGLGVVSGQFVAREVQQSRFASEIDLARILARPGRAL